MVRLQTLGFTSLMVERLRNKLCKGHELTTPQTGGNSNVPERDNFQTGDKVGKTAPNSPLG